MQGKDPTDARLLGEASADEQDARWVCQGSLHTSSILLRTPQAALPCARLAIVQQLALGLHRLLRRLRCQRRLPGCRRRRIRGAAIGLWGVDAVCRRREGRSRHTSREPLKSFDGEVHGYAGQVETQTAIEILRSPSGVADEVSTTEHDGEYACGHTCKATAPQVGCLQGEAGVFFARAKLSAPVVSVDILAASAASSAARWVLVRNGCELPVLSATLPALSSLAALPLARAAGRGLVYTMLPVWSARGATGRVAAG